MDHDSRDPQPPQDRWQAVTALFNDALELDEEGRKALLAAADPGLRREVESLLAAHHETGPFDRLAAATAAQVANLRSATTLASHAAASGTRSGDEPESPRLGPGHRLGRHEIRTRLGAGGMGEVYRALDTRLHREVAIKILRQRTQLRPGALPRFEQEARAASALNHPNIVTVHDIGEEDSFPYIVMELVEGQSLRQMIDAPLPALRLLHLAAQIADGLVAAHERPMIHGDVKPENILVTHQGIVKIVDFGLAQVWLPEAAADPGAADQSPDCPSSRPRSRQGPLLGTPGYLAPELIAGEPADQRSDQFSLGAILHEMATGVPAFVGSGVLDLLGQTLLHDPPDLAGLRPDLPAGFVRAIERCLRKDRNERYPATRQLLEQLRAARKGPERTGRAPSPRRPSTLPAQRTRLIGRQREIEAIDRLLGAEQHVRLVTLTGPGGTGKTRLAQRAAEALAPRFPGGVFFVALAALTEPALVPSTIAQTLGTVIRPGQPAQAAVIAELRAADAPTLLVLDNFEQVIDAAGAVGELVAACPDLTVIVTSREVLRIYGEQVFPVVALDLPNPARLPAAADLLAFPAVALFVERAQAVNPGFTLDADNAAAVAALCAGLDGLPLALELAAAQIRAQTPAAMLARLTDRLGLLTRGARDLPSRQQTLRATFDWSHDLLEPTLQAIFRRLAVFAGGFTREAARAVVDPFGKLDLAVDEGIAALVDKSLLHPQEPPRRPPRDDEPRFAMLETVRAYALQKLSDSGESERTCEAHAAYFLVLGEEGAPALAAADQPLVLRRFEIEHDNFRAALEWLTRRGRAEWATRLGLALFRFWDRGEHLAEGRRRLNDVIALPGTRALPLPRAQAMFAAGVLASEQGDMAAGIDLHTQCLRTYRAQGDRWGTVTTLVALGNQYVAQGDHAQARGVIEESLQLWEALGDQAGFGRSLANLAFVAQSQGDHAGARDLYQRAAALFERQGDPPSRAWALNHEGDVARAQGDLDAAVTLIGAALAVFRSIDDGWGVASSLADLGTIARQRGDHDSACHHLDEALAGFVALDHPRGIARVLECLACLAADQGQPARGLQLAGAASALRDRVGGGPVSPAGRAELERNCAEMRSSLGAETARKVWQQGAMMAITEALALATASASIPTR